MLFLPGPSPISVYLQHKQAGCVDVFSAFSEMLCLAEMPLMIFLPSHMFGDKKWSSGGEIR